MKLSMTLRVLLRQKMRKFIHRKTYLLGSLTAAVRRRKETAIERKNSNKKGEKHKFSTLDFLQI